MKNLKRLFSLAILLFAMVLIGSCNKDDQATIKNKDSKLISATNATRFMNSNTSNIVNDKTVKDNGWGIHRHLIKDFPNRGDIWCGYPPIDCFDDVVIPLVNESNDIYNKLISAYHSKNDDNIIDFFKKENWKLLFKNLSNNDINNIINKKNKVIIQSNIINGLEDKHTQNVIIVNNNNNNVVFVYPFKIASK